MTTKYRGAIVWVRVTLLMCTHQVATSKGQANEQRPGVTRAASREAPHNGLSVAAWGFEGIILHGLCPLYARLCNNPFFKDIYRLIATHVSL
jgi:hypothetical protein